ncbi:flagella basal body P-ring formation protein FlgA [Xaviernesmea oryzae]|uniref:Flagella basal body P-ring formation protein FlgA n=1 Tax=Xaviernesmea oryzae TaxID=464029 RepID=A0A1Q9AS30_9HYPH|nr:flagellar basal body P-ring formation chaperone FlgA [Xaviernesmea oryzae]OLP58188.1 flagella basal body P-ring formation protein FlgA [Xaviernesmea oryzae]SEL47379.1 flagella basal body P-ring formation protein FlgA [Xaviernesmea oryzae]
MMFRRISFRHHRLAAATLAAASVALAALTGSAPARAEGMTAVIPKETIYPGETIVGSQLEVVDVTNPNLSGDFAQTADQVVGKVTTRTLLSGRVILVSGLRQPYAVERGKAVRLVFNNGPLVISAGGSPLENAAVGDLIRVRNTDSGIIVSGTVMADGTVQVVAK